MTAQQLRNSILQQAIQGRLVPQDPNDEPASVVIDKSLYKGKISILQEEEYPVEIPSNWCFCRLQDVAITIGGYAFKSDELKGNIGTRVIRISDVTPSGFSNKNIVRYNNNLLLEQYEVHEDDILIAMTGGTVGKSLYVDNLPERLLLNQRVAIVRAENIYPLYLDLVIKSPLTQDIVSERKNSTNDNISMVDIKGFPIPLPPLAEQRRIVAKIEELMPLVEKYGKAQTELDTLNQDLPRRLRQSVLQQAIQGKLVEQDEKEGNASELLLRLREVRRNKIKSGEIKLSKPEKALKIEISNDFDLPSSWTWCVLNDVCRAFGRIGFRGYTKEDIVSSKEEGAIAISPSNMENLRLNFNKCTYITEAKYQESPEIMVENGDVLLTKTASVGKLALVENLPWKATINPQIAVLKEISIDNKYLTYVLASPYIQDIIHGFTIGTSIPTYSQEKMLGINIPLPPLAEQRRIVAKIEELFAEIDKLK